MRGDARIWNEIEREVTGSDSNAVHSIVRIGRCTESGGVETKTIGKELPLHVIIAKFATATLNKLLSCNECEFVVFQCEILFSPVPLDHDP